MQGIATSRSARCRISPLDRLSPIKEVAQIGAAIGREFTYRLLAAIAPLSSIALQSALERLTLAGLIFSRGEPPDSTYTFKHALLQDAREAESSHDPCRCSQSCTRLGCSSSTCSSRRAGWKPRICFFAINSASP
jgi:hypothetical protein